MEKLKFPLDRKLTLPNEPVAYLQCKWLSTDQFNPPVDQICFHPPLSLTSVKPAKVHRISLMTKSEDVKSKIELILDFDEEFNVDYIPGDTVGIFPTNSSSEVGELLDCLGLNEKSTSYFKIEILDGTSKKNAAIPKYVPEITTAELLFSKYLEIRAPIKKLMLRSLCGFTKDDKERRRLEEFASKEGTEEYSNWILGNNITLLNLLKTFHTCKPSISALLEHLPAIKPRVYSIASSPLVDRKLLRFIITVVEKSDSTKGVCSGYLYDMLSDSSELEDKMKSLNIRDCHQSALKVPMFFRQPNSFRFLDDGSVNLILIGPGSGVAPFIGFLEHKKALAKSESASSGETWLFFGCRNENDFIFKKEMEQFLSEGVLNKLFISFSRPSLATGSKYAKYVQDSIMKVKDEFISLFIKSDTRVFICGDARNMINDVLSKIKLCLKQVQDITDEESDSLIKDFTKSGKILIDSWI